MKTKLITKYGKKALVLLCACLAAAALLIGATAARANADALDLLIEDFEADNGGWVNSTRSAAQKRSGGYSTKANGNAMVPLGELYSAPMDLSGYEGLRISIYVQNDGDLPGDGDGQLEVSYVDMSANPTADSFGARNIFGGHKYGWALGGLNLKAGWNDINFKFSEGNMGSSKPSLSAINYIGFYFTNARNAEIYFDDVWAIVNFPTVTIPPCTASGYHIDGFNTGSGWSGGTLTDAEGMVKEGDKSLSTTGLGIVPIGKKFEPALDLSDYDAITFWLYVSNVTVFNSMADGQFELRASDTSGDAQEIHWSLKNIPNLKAGWNFVTFMFADADKTGSVSEGSIGYIRFYFDALIGNPVTVAFDQLHANSVAGLQIDSFDAGAGWSDSGSFGIDAGEAYHKEGTGAMRMDGQGIGSNGKSYAEPFDFTGFDALAMWIFVSDVTAFNSMGDGQFELREDSSKNDSDEIHWSLKNIPNLKTGWNRVLFPFDGADKAGGAALSKIQYIRFYFVGLTSSCTVVFDDLRAVESQFMADTTPIEGIKILPLDKLAAGVFDSMTLDFIDHKEGYAAHTTAGNNSSEALTAAFDAGVTNLALSGANQLVMTLWLYIDDIDAVTAGFIELSSSTNADTLELEWNMTSALDDLTDGWNWLVLPAGYASQVGGIIDTNELKRIRVSVTASANITVKLDRISIMNASTAGYDEVPPSSEKLTFNPVDTRLIASADTTDADTFSGLPLEQAAHKQGYAAVILSKTASPAQRISTKLQNLNVGQTDLLVNNYTSANEFGLTFWFHVSDQTAAAVASLTVEAASANHADFTTSVAVWTVSTGLASGWNWVVLKAGDAAITGIVDADAISAVRFTVSAVAADGGYAAVATMLDRVSVVNAAIPANIAAPSQNEQLIRNPVTDRIIVNCDVVSQVYFQGNAIERADYREGLGAVKTSGSGYALNANGFTVGKTDLTKESLVLGFWIWIQDPALYNPAAVNGQVEISSSASYDTNELSWEIKALFKELDEGWNWVALTGASAAVSGGMPDFDNLIRFRIYVNNIANSELRLDRITLTNIGAPDYAAAPDWESEIGGGDGEFAGGNVYAPKNPSFLEADLSEPTEIKEKETVSQKVSKTGCGCGSAAVGGAAAGALALAALALAVGLRGAAKSRRAG
jgi:hypothetical protein